MLIRLDGVGTEADGKKKRERMVYEATKLIQMSYVDYTRTCIWHDQQSTLDLDRGCSVQFEELKDVIIR